MKLTPLKHVLALLLPVIFTYCAWAQSDPPAPDSSRGLQVQSSRPRLSQQQNLPDAPDAQPRIPIDKFQIFVQDATSPLNIGAAGFNARLMSESQERLPPGMQSSRWSLYGSAVAQRESSVFFSKYLYPSLLKQDPRYHPSTSNSFLGRAAYAASRLVLTRNDAGHTTINTSYLLGVLTSTAVSSAYRPYWQKYWRQSTSTTFAEFGSSVGNDAGINLLHEFWPGIHRRLVGHAPKFVQRIDKTHSRESGYDASSYPASEK